MIDRLSSRTHRLDQSFLAEQLQGARRYLSITGYFTSSLFEIAHEWLEPIPEVHLGLTEYFSFYNSERPHQNLGYRTPDEVHHSGQGGGAVVVDLFSTDEPATSKEACCATTASSGKDLGQRQTAAAGE